MNRSRLGRRSFILATAGALLSLVVGGSPRVARGAAREGVRTLFAGRVAVVADEFIHIVGRRVGDTRDSTYEVFDRSAAEQFEPANEAGVLLVNGTISVVPGHYSTFGVAHQVAGGRRQMLVGNQEVTVSQSAVIVDAMGERTTLDRLDGQRVFALYRRGVNERAVVELLRLER